MVLTTDRSDPNLGYGSNTEPVPQNESYLVLSEEERSKGFMRPVRYEYIHSKELGGCGARTTMETALSETYARDIHFYGVTYCVGCSMHRPVGENGEFYWDGTKEKVGT